MEACSSAHHRAHWLNWPGIEVWLLPAAYIRVYVKLNKTDVVGANALLEAARCADIASVRIKSVLQRCRIRFLWMSTRTLRNNAWRGFCQNSA